MGGVGRLKLDVCAVSLRFRRLKLDVPMVSSRFRRLQPDVYMVSLRFRRLKPDVYMVLLQFLLCICVDTLHLQITQTETYVDLVSSRFCRLKLIMCVVSVCGNLISFVFIKFPQTET